MEVGDTVNLPGDRIADKVYNPLSLLEDYYIPPIVQQHLDEQKATADETTRHYDREDKRIELVQVAAHILAKGYGPKYALDSAAALIRESHTHPSLDTY